MMKKGDRRAPAVRFKGFIDDWEQRKLGDIGKTQSGIGFPDAEQGGTEGVPFFKISDMNNTGNEHEMITSNNYVDNEQLQRRKWKPIESVPAIIFAKVGAAIMLNRKRLVRIPFLIDNNTMAYIYDESWAINFGKTLFETINLSIYAQVGALPSYNSSDIESIEVKVPRKEEQNQIGTFFAQLDNTITLLQRKLDKLKQLKQGFLQQMFPQNGENLPRLRFANFEGEWEQRKLGEIVFRILTSSDNPNIPRVEFEDIVSGEGRLNKDICIKYDIRKGILFKDRNILFGKLRPYLKKWLFTDFTGIAIGDFWVFKAQNSSPIFDYYLIQTEKYLLAANLSSGSKMPRSDWNTVAETEFRIPLFVEEQNEIGELLEQFDDIISLIQKKVDKLKRLKTAFLQKMFI